MKVLYGKAVYNYKEINASIKVLKNNSLTLIDGPLVKRLEKKGIQTRTIFTGNILRQPIMKNLHYKKNNKPFVNSDNIMKNGLLIGCHHGLNKIEMNFMLNTLKKFIHNLKMAG